MKKCRILLAEDDPDDKLLLQDAFSTLGAEEVIEFVDNGEQVLKKLQDADSDLPDLIVVDVNMPKIGGMQTLERLKADQRLKNIPVLIYTTSTNPLDEEKSFRLGAKGYVIKPSSFKKLIETVKFFMSFFTPGQQMIPATARVPGQ